MKSFSFCLLLVIYFFLIVRRSNGTTFSSRLVHRFSDEAKAVWISRNVNVSADSWPKRNGFEYLQALLENDLKRRQLKVGAQNQLLFPARGSKTLSFGNDLAWLHYTWVDIGTPNVSFLVALDAGSNLFWVPCDCIQCAPLSAGFYNSLDRDLNEYRPSLSSTSRHLPCNHELCESDLICGSSKEPCSYIVNYDDSQNTSSSGLLVEDKLHLVSVSEPGKQKKVQASVVIGCGRKQTGSYLDGAAPDGVMGLGPGNISVPGLLARAGLTRNSFSLCFEENGSGRILFGDQGHASQLSTPFVPVEGNYVAYFVHVESACVGGSCLKQSGFKAMVDSGSSFTFLPPDVYNGIVLEFDKQLDAKRISFPDGPWDYCYNTSLLKFKSIPSLHLLLDFNQSFVVHNPTYSIGENQEFTLFCLPLQPTDEGYGIIGQNFITGYHMVFDMENRKLGWSKSNCQTTSYSPEVNLQPPSNGASPTSLPTNEQQSIPNTLAVAPAVAGMTSKPSAASHLTIPSRPHRTCPFPWLLLVYFFSTLM
ncbi:hypothetical protein K2173_026790 [Erythroxylum novogranatense]|uniref:Peptidase A1 domain-containing protein n=1 Tax=Erythroxylum novogranatense TaxID=1862640 RepID=A0AAV8TXK2_9ROSI|nr:hypothetical protein K2173_026790 [Erythroxylum novogranatense]